MSAARLVVRLLTSLVMSLLGLVLAVPTAVALAEPPSPANGHRLISVQAAPSRAAAERGQPSTWDAVLSAARGASARPDGGQSNTIYDDPALFSSADNATAHIARVQAARASNLMGPLSSLHRTTVAANGADNVVNGTRLGQQLARESADSVFTSSGRLSSGAIAESRQIISGSRLGNKDLIQRLTSDGSDIADWGKYTTRTHQSPSGDFQVHFYMNRGTGAIDYG